MRPLTTSELTATLLGVASVTLSLLSGCTHTLTFSDTTPIVVTGTPPAPPPVGPPPTLPAEPAKAPAPKKVEVQRDHIVIHDKIQFETDQAAIKPESYELLQEITQVVNDNPQILRLSIEGHTDSTGADAHNQSLSEQRAAAVQDYLIAHGVAGDRLSSRGWGESKPLADNNTVEGRESNRRVEFVILEQGTPSADSPPADPPTSPVGGGAL